MDINSIPSDIKDKLYSDSDIHTIYIGEVVNILHDQDYVLKKIYTKQLKYRLTVQKQINNVKQLQRMLLKMDLFFMKMRLHLKTIQRETLVH